MTIALGFNKNVEGNAPPVFMSANFTTMSTLELMLLMSLFISVTMLRSSSSFLSSGLRKTHAEVIDGGGP